MSAGIDPRWRYPEYFRLSRAKPILANRVDPAIEAAVVELAIEQPSWGQLRVSNELKKRGQSISAFGVRGVWQRHDLENIKNG